MITINPHKMKILALYFLIYFGYYKVLFFEITPVLVVVQIVFLATIALIILNSLIKNRILSLNNVLIFMFIYFLWIFISAFNTPSHIYANDKMSNMMVTSLYCLFAYYFSFEVDIYTLLKYIFKINLFLVFVYIVINASDVVASISSSSRIGDIRSDNPIWIGRFCTDTFLAMLAYDILLNKEMKMKRIVQYVFLLAVIFYSGSKGPWLALIICVVMSLNILSQSGKMKKKIITITFFLGIVVLMIAILGSSYLIPYINSRVLYTFSFVKGSRLNQYIYTFGKIKENPLLGYGLGSWPLYYWGRDILMYPHNIILEIWFELGIIGIGFFIIYNIILCKGFKMGNVAYKVLFILFISNLIYAMFSGSISEGNRGIYLFAVILAANYKKKKDLIEGVERNKDESNLYL